MDRTSFHFTLPTVAGIFAVLLLAACGGGSTGIVDLPRESGCYNCDYRRNNPTAADLLDHWNDPQPVTAALTLSAVSAQEATARKAALASLSSADTGPRARLRNADLNRMTVLGEGDGITYGQWKAGPAGTMNIEFRWLPAEPDRDPLTPGATLRARTERAGKAWSYRLRDDFAPTPVPASLAPREHLVDLADTVADDLLINVFYARDYGYSSALWSRARETDTDFEPWMGNMFLAPGGHWDSAWVIAHEIGHVLGHDMRDRVVAPSADRWVNRENHTFEGPAAVAANNGRPIRFHRHEDGRVDYGHLGHCDDHVPL